MDVNACMNGCVLCLLGLLGLRYLIRLRVGLAFFFSFFLSCYISLFLPWAAWAACPDSITWPVPENPRDRRQRQKKLAQFAHLMPKSPRKPLHWRQRFEHFPLAAPYPVSTVLCKAYLAESMVAGNFSIRIKQQERTTTPRTHSSMQQTKKCTQHATGVQPPHYRIPKLETWLRILFGKTTSTHPARKPTAHKNHTSESSDHAGKCRRAFGIHNRWTMVKLPRAQKQ